MSVIAPRCHLCHALKSRTASGLLVCLHCDLECTASKERRPCDACKQGGKSSGRGPHS